MPNPIKFRRPEEAFFVENRLSGTFSDFCLEMDVNDTYPVESLLENYSLDDVKVSFNSTYLKFKDGILTAIKQTGDSTELTQLNELLGGSGCHFDPGYTYVDFETKTGGLKSSLQVRIYDRPTGIKLITTLEEIEDYFGSIPGDTMDELEKSTKQTGQLLQKDGLEMKPGETFLSYFIVLPETAQQELRLRSNNSHMQDIINKMILDKGSLNSSRGTLKGVYYTIPEDSKFYAGNPDFKETDKYGTFLATKRGRKDSGKPEIEVQLQIVEYFAEEPKPLDYLATTLPVVFKNSVGGRIGTIDGGLRIFKDATGRSLVKDVYKNIPADTLRKYAKAVVLEMTEQGVPVMKPGIDYTYFWNKEEKEYCLYEPDLKAEKSRYKDIHGFAVAVHPYGKKMTWSDQKEAVDYSSSAGWKAADEYYRSPANPTSTSGFRLTTHYHSYNNSVPQNKGVNPVRCLKDYHYKWPGLLFTGIDSNGSDIVSYWLLPSIDECHKMDMKGYRSLTRALAEHINYVGGELTNPSRFWTASLVKKDLSRVQTVSWDDYYGVTSVYADKNEEYDFRPFHRF